MRNVGLSVVVLFLASVPLRAQESAHPYEPPKSPQTFELPKLHVINTVTLSPSYSCRSAEDFARGYESTALFLSPYAKRRNSPDLLFNGGCRAKDYFEAATAGDDMSLVADLGAGVSLEEVSAAGAFNLQRVHTPDAYTKFAQTARVELNHTYAVLLNGRERRGLFIFTVVGHAPNEKVELRYAVKSYQITQGGQAVAPGFDWGRGNDPAPH